jgi:uncharacterized membrane protein YgcG
MANLISKKYIFLLFGLFFLNFVSAQEYDIPESKGFVNDYAGVFSEKEERELEDSLQKFYKRSGVQIGLAIEETLNGLEKFDRAMMLARGWKIGQKGANNGILVYIAVNERKYHILVARDMQGDLPDGLVGEMARNELVPYIKDDQYYKGCKSILNALTSVAGKGRKYIPVGKPWYEEWMFIPTNFAGWVAAIILGSIIVLTWVLGISRNLAQRNQLNQRGAELGIKFNNVK